MTTQYPALTPAVLPVLPKLDARIPGWSLDRLRLRACPLCGEANPPAFERPDRLPVAFCADCGLWYVSSLPPAEEIERLYQGYWFSFRPKDLSAGYAARLAGDRDALESDVRLNRLGALCGRLDGKRLLEIGCGCGEFLVAARHRGANVFGNDISAEACEFVAGRLGVPVFPGPLAPAEFIRRFGRVDIVVMSDLIEHPIDPLDTFQSALETLEPGGLLLVLTPNGGAASTGRSGRDATSGWVGFRVDLEHLQYFSSASIARLAARFGCLIEHLETFGYPALEGIDRQPTTEQGRRSLGAMAKRQLRESPAGRKLMREVRPHWELLSRAPDPRRGSYHLLAIFRKLAPRA